MGLRISDNNREGLGLPSAFLALGEAISAVHRTITAGFERYFTFFFAVGTDRLEPFSLPSPESTALLKCHVISPF